MYKEILPNGKRIWNREKLRMGLFARYSTKYTKKDCLAYSENITTPRTVIIGMVTGLELHEIVR